MKDFGKYIRTDATYPAFM